MDKNNAIRVNRRVAGDIWQGLYDFLLIETEKDTDEKKLFSSQNFKREVGKNYKVLNISKIYKHILSHQNIYAKFYVIKLNSAHPKIHTSRMLKQLTKFAFPRLVEKYLNDCKLNELF